MRISSSDLKTILKRFSGYPCAAPLPKPKGGSLRLFTSQDLAPFQANTLLSMGHHTQTEPTHLSTLIYRLLHTINQIHSPCIRFLDNQWYHFGNLPLLLSTKDNQQSNTWQIDSPTTLSQSDFLEMYEAGRQNPVAASEIEHAIGHHITTVAFDYNGAIPRNAQLPHFVVSQQPPGHHHTAMLTVMVPRANCTPIEFNSLVTTLKTDSDREAREHPTQLMGM